MNLTDYRLDEHGFEIIKSMLPGSIVRAIIDEIDALDATVARHAIRNAEKKLKSVAQLVLSPVILQQAEKRLQDRVKPVRVIVFDKTADKNWLVSWHQDRTVIVERRFEKEGWGPWTVKDGAIHVQPPLHVLENMLTFRFHLDAVGRCNGCLKVIPGTHTAGVLVQDDIDDLRDEKNTVYCEVDQGDVLIMRPLLLHASAKATHPHHRRIVHVEYAASNSFQI